MLQIIVMGPSGSGKSTVGAALASRLGVPFLDADDLHPASNVAKMASGIPLTDADRMPWLELVAAATAAASATGIVVACSALTRSYREAIERGAPDAVFVELTGSRELLLARSRARAGHFMPVALLDSQLATLQPLEPDENGFRVDIDQDLASMVAEIVGAVTG